MKSKNTNGQIFVNCIIFFGISLGVPMAHLQESGLYNGNTYLIRKDVDFGRVVKEFTLCARLSLNFLRGDTNYWVHISNQNNLELLTGSEYTYIT